jgi:hypothetical protein
MAKVTWAVEQANLVIDVAILTEIVAYLFAQVDRSKSSGLDLKRLPERIMERIHEQLEPLEDMSQDAHDRRVEVYRARLTLLLDSINAYRKPDVP